MVDATLAHNQKEWEQMQKYMDYLYDHHEDKAVRLAMNEVARKCKTNLVKYIAQEPLQQSLRGRHFRNQALPKLPPIKARSKDIRSRIYVRGARGSHKEAKIIGYANDVPAISLATVKNRKAGTSTAKGKFTQTRTHGKPRAGSKPGTQGRKLKNPTQGGIKLGGTTLPDAFINVTRYNKKVHIMRRTSPRTWKPGKSGWGYPTNAAPWTDRMPMGVVKYDLFTPMKAKFEPIIAFTVRVNAQDSYNRAMGYLLGKAAANS